MDYDGESSLKKTTTATKQTIVSVPVMKNIYLTVTVVYMVLVWEIRHSRGI